MRVQRSIVSQDHKEYGEIVEEESEEAGEL